MAEQATPPSAGAAEPTRPTEPTSPTEPTAATFATAAPSPQGQPAALRRLIRSTMQLLYPGTEAAETGTLAEGEGRALVAALWSGGIGLLVGLIAFWGGNVPLTGGASPGLVSAVTAAATGTVACIVAYLRETRGQSPQWSRGFSRAKRWLDAVAIALVHVAIMAMIVLLVFQVLGQSFIGVRVDTFTGTMIVTAISAVTGYVTTLSASTITARSLSVLLGIYLTAGIVVAMMTTSMTNWWELHFSELGVGEGISQLVFNLTMAGGGLLMTTLAFYLARDLDAWAVHAAPSTTRNVSLVQWSFVLIGLCLIGVALVPVDVSLWIHNTFATGMAVVFGLLLIRLRWLLDGFPRAFLVFSDTVAISIAVGALLFWPMQYYTLAAFEIIAALLIFVWLIIFIRHVGALGGARTP